MYFKKKSHVIFRNYKSFGYLTDNRNFGYKLTGIDENDIGDKILSESGAVLLSVLGNKPQNLDEIALKLSKRFSDVDISTIRKDARDFYGMLEQNGFIVSGDTLPECEKKDTKFSYKKLEPREIYKSFSPTLTHHEKSTQVFLEDHFQGRPQLTNVHIEINSECNERCIHCYIPHGNKVSSIEPELFYNVLKQCRKMRLLHITLSGGEPMLHKNFCDFLRICREYDFSVNVLSNLTLLNDEIVNELKTSPLFGVQVSLYSMNSRVHDEITQTKGSFDKTKSAILKLVENNIPLQISCPILKQNKNCYLDVIKWAKDYRIYVGEDYAIIGRYDHSTQNLRCRLSIDEIREIIGYKIVNDINYIKQLETEVEKKKKSIPSDFVCSVCHSSICIADNGNVYPCAGWQDYVIGNVKVTPLKEIWDGNYKVKYLRNLRKQDFPKCIQCPDKEFCDICLVRNSNESSCGDPLEISEYYCRLANLNKQFYYSRKEKLSDSK